MIIGLRDVDYSTLRKHCKDVETLRAYSDSLVPRIIRHNTAIVDNQRYYIALLVRNIKSLPYALRKELYEGLLTDVSITGVSNVVYDFDDLMAAVDIDKLIRYVQQRVRDK